MVRLLPAETSHKLHLALLGFASKLPTGRWWLRHNLAPRGTQLQREVFGVHFRNPIGVAAGFDPNGDYIRELDNIGFGFVEIGSIIPHPQPGTPRPRLERLRSLGSLIDRSGYPCRGLEHALDNVRGRNNKHGRIVVGCNIGKCTSTPARDITKEYLRVFRNMYQYVDYFAINIACNTSSKPFVPTTREEILALIEPMFEFRRGQLDYRPILLKISPDLSREQIDDIVSILIETPLDGIEAVAGSTALSADGEGAVSGAALTERAIEMVRYIHRRSEGNYPIIGSGGMMQPDDIKRMIEAGASLVALNTGVRENGFRLLRHAANALITPAETPAEVSAEASGTAAVPAASEPTAPQSPKSEQ